MGEFWIAIAILLIGLSFYTFRILREYERGVIFFLGRFQTCLLYTSDAADE